MTQLQAPVTEVHTHAFRRRARAGLAPMLIVAALVGFLALASHAGAYVYWTQGGSDTIGRANLDGGAVDQNFIAAVDPSRIAVDAQHVYWTNGVSGTIGRANIDGSGINQNFITGASNPAGIAVDAEHIFW